ncbi:hypothetical protein FZEAL_3501 [Fusarium zealandicum]|uniref:Hypersensitive response-inducing protein n=1 Tax=Fusarium zealandicum TaxID=1053134 RepID=A0A8H4XMW7_9HYPO|nr:hypothetical protein FZEAL_3501 [Fusarium zealandicum]
MKFFATALVSAAAVSASLFEVRDFSASCMDHSTQCRYAFHVIRTGSMATWKHPTHCAVLVGSGTGLLPNVKDAECDSSSSKTFDVVRGQKGLTLTITQGVSASNNESASHHIPYKQLQLTKPTQATLQSYKGPTRFFLDEVMA